MKIMSQLNRIKVKLDRDMEKKKIEDSIEDFSY